MQVDHSLFRYGMSLPARSKILHDLRWSDNVFFTFIWITKKSRPVLWVKLQGEVLNGLALILNTSLYEFRLYTTDISLINVELQLENENLGGVSLQKCRLTGIGIPMLKIRRSPDRLIFNTGIPIPGNNPLYIETEPKHLGKTITIDS